MLIVLGVFSIVVGWNLKSAENTWNEIIAMEEVIPGTKGRNAALGAGAGAVGGGLLAAVVGGVGVVACGTGIGMPAGAGLIATAAALGAGGGALAGAATGKSATTKIHKKNVSHTRPAYQTWHWISVIAVGVILCILAVVELLSLRYSRPRRQTPKPTPLIPN